MDCLGTLGALLVKYFALALGTVIGVLVVASVLLGLFVLAIGVCSRIRRAWDDLFSRRRVVQFTQREKLTEQEEREAAECSAAFVRAMAEYEQWLGSLTVAEPKRRLTW